jgi:hypothetical protein
MSWWQARKARKDLEKMGLDKDYLKQMGAELSQAKKLHNELRKQESPTYVRLIAKINDLTYEPVPSRQRYEMSLDLVRQASLSDWERNDLLTQIDSIYGEVLKARPYVQVLSGLNHIKSSQFSQAQKITLSMRLLKSYNLSETEAHEITGQIRKFYKM